MFTILMTIFGLVVFIFSLLLTTFKVAFKRLLMFAGFGLALDLILFAVFAVVAYLSL